MVGLFTTSVVSNVEMSLLRKFGQMDCQKNLNYESKKSKKNKS